MDDIRAAAGISLKRLYKLFRSKDEVIAGYLELKDRRFRAGLARHVDAVADPRAKVLAVFDWLGEWFAEDDFRGCAFINSYGELGATNPAVAQAAKTHKQSVRDVLTRLCAAVGGDSDLADQISLLAEGAITTAAISGSTAPAAQAKRGAAVLLDAYASRR